MKKFDGFLPASLYRLGTYVGRYVPLLRSLTTEKNVPGNSGITI